MKKTFLSTVALIAMASSASAADLPSHKAPIAVAIPTWTGFYTGLNLGGGIGTNSPVTNSQGQIGNVYYLDPGNAVPNLSQSMFGGVIANQNSMMTQSGVIGGGQIGYNYQWNQKFVVGVEADIQGSSIGGGSTNNGLLSTSSPSFYECDGACGYEQFTQGGVVQQKVSAGVNWMGTVRGRVGYLISPTLLTFATGGLTYGGVYANASSFSVQTAQLNNEIIGPQKPVTIGLYGTANQTDTLVGWNAGGGLEWMFMTDWSLKAEAIYWNMGNMNLSTTSFSQIGNMQHTEAADKVAFQPSILSAKSAINYQGIIARLGVNYHFNLASIPVVAKF